MVQKGKTNNNISSIDESTQLKRVFDAIQDGIIIVDMNYRIMRFNRWIEEKFQSKIPFAGEKCKKIFTNRAEPCRSCPDLNILETGKPHQWIVKYPMEHHPEQWFEISMTRLDEGYWEQVDVYISKHMKTGLSHGVCPDCMKTYYPEEHAAIEAQNKEEQKEE